MNPELHVAVKLLLAVFAAVLFALESFLSYEALSWLFLKTASLTEELHQARSLGLLLKALLERFVTFIAVLVCVNCH